MLGSAFYGVSMMNINNPASPSIMYVFATPQACGFQKCVILSDNIRMICSCREVGTFFFKIVNSQFVIQAIFKEIASEYPMLSSDETTVFISNGFQGLFILDITDFSNPKKISHLILKGWVQMLVTLYNEKYIAAVQQDKGQIALINIEDLSNPYVQQLVEFQNESSTSICITPTEKTIFFTGVSGIRSLPITSSVKVHT